MKEMGIWEPSVVKTQSLKTAVESACMLLRIDDVVAGAKKSGKERQGGSGAAQEDADEPEEGAAGDDRVG
jgi:T-complex protein 1 subunit gamma